MRGKPAYEVPHSHLPSAGTPVLGGANDALVTVATDSVSIDLDESQDLVRVVGTISGSPVVNAGIVYAFAHKRAVRWAIAPTTLTGTSPALSNYWMMPRGSREGRWPARLHRAMGPKA